MDDSRGNQKGVESIYGKTIGPYNGNNRPLPTGIIEANSIYGTHHHNKGSSGSVLSHMGSNNYVSTGGIC